MKMMKSLVVAGSFALALCVAIAPTIAQVPTKGSGAAPGAKNNTPGAKTPQIKGVNASSIHVINGNRDHDTKVLARVGDVVQINWALKASPPTTSTTVSSSNSKVLKVGATRHLDNINGPTGASGDIVVRFTAQRKGTSKVTWKIVRTPTDFSIVTSLVQVQ
jgi:hypothetical protein